jgi:hypothetical protein
MPGTKTEHEINAAAHSPQLTATLKMVACHIIKDSSFYSFYILTFIDDVVYICRRLRKSRKFPRSERGALLPGYCLAQSAAVATNLLLLWIYTLYDSSNIITRVFSSCFIFAKLLLTCGRGLQLRSALQAGFKLQLQNAKSKRKKFFNVFHI